MNANEVMKKAIADARVTQKELATTMQLKSAASLTNYLKSDVRISTFIHIMNTLGYSVCVKNDKTDEEIELE